MWWYSLFKGSIYYIIFIIFLVQYLTKGYILKNEMKRWGKAEARLYSHHPKAFDLPIIALTAILAIWGFMEGTLPLLRDYPLMQNHQYETIVGITKSQSVKRPHHSTSRSITIEDLGTGEEVLITFLTEGVEEGEYVVAYYLPHSKIGVLVEQVDLDE